MKHLSTAAIVLMLSACTNATQAPTATVDTTQVTQTIIVDTAATTPQELKGDYCFLKAENKDTTTVRLRILSTDDIRGEMIWTPYQKDGAVGSLTGKMNANNEIELMYEYTIEGSRQSETKIMKIENNKLFMKVGQLTDPKNDGNMIYKDATKAVYKDGMTKVNCD